MSPGPNVLAIIGTSMSLGRKSGVALACGVAMGSSCWALLTVVGLSTLLASYAAAITAIKIVGGIYLLWLGYKSFRAAVSAQDMEARALAGPVQTRLRYFLRGFTVQMTNPKAALAWIAIVSLGLQAGAPLWVGASIIGGTAFLSLVIHGLYAMAFSTQTMIRVYAKARRGIQSFLGLFFCFAGVKLLTSRL
jgi:threonine/homoserine/homoserine lactone efflux protein